jgi:hypothetical protein
LDGALLLDCQGCLKSGIEGGEGPKYGWLLLFGSLEVEMPHNFIDRDVFEQLINQIETTKGGKYQDIATIYGDLSRLVVAIVANTEPAKLQETYNQLQWKGSANVRAMHEVANYWYKIYHPEHRAKS